MKKEKCTKRHAQIVKKSVKYRSSQVAIDLFIAGIAIKSTGHQDVEDIKARQKECGRVF